jgi:hypothetical protein
MQTSLKYPALRASTLKPGDGKDSQNKHTDLRPRAVFTNL